MLHLPLDPLNLSSILPRVQPGHNLASDGLKWRIWTTGAAWMEGLGMQQGLLGLGNCQSSLDKIWDFPDTDISDL